MGMFFYWNEETNQTTSMKQGSGAELKFKCSGANKNFMKMHLSCSGLSTEHCVGGAERHTSAILAFGGNFSCQNDAITVITGVMLLLNSVLSLVYPYEQS